MVRTAGDAFELWYGGPSASFVRCHLSTKVQADIMSACVLVSLVADPILIHALASHHATHTQQRALSGQGKAALVRDMKSVTRACWGVDVDEHSRRFTRTHTFHHLLQSFVVL